MSVKFRKILATLCLVTVAALLLTACSNGSPNASITPDVSSPADDISGGDNITDNIDSSEPPDPEVPAVLLISEDFENYEETFEPDGEVEFVGVSTDFAASGTNSLLVKNPSNAQNYHGVVLNNKKLVSPGMQPTGKYRLTAKIYAIGPESGTPSINIRVDSTKNGADSWGGIKDSKVTLTLNEWVDVAVEFEVPESHELVKRIAFINGSQLAGLVYYIDDVKLEVLREPIPVEQETWESGLPSLSETYGDYFLFGSILEPSILDSAETLDMFKYQYNAVTLENSMKPDNMVKNVDGNMVFTFENADMVVAWAEANNIAVHGHTLVWHAQSPAWLTKDADGKPLTRAEAKANLEEYITAVAGHYKGKVISWDVVNEAVTGGLTSPWKRAYENGMDEAAGEEGNDYIYDAFVLARIADPDAVLYFNDYNEHLSSTSQQIYNLVKKYNDRWAADKRNTEPGRLLIEGVGMQAHYWSAEERTLINDVKTAIDLFRTLGVEISVSELDIPAGSAGTLDVANSAVKATQAMLYAKLFEIYRENADVITRVTLWGRDDASSWRGGSGGSASPLHFDGARNAKPAFWAILDPAEFLKDK